MQHAHRAELCTLRTYCRLGLACASLLLIAFLAQWTWYRAEANRANQALIEKQEALQAEERLFGPAGDRFGRRAIASGQTQAASELCQFYVDEKDAAGKRAVVWPLAFLAAWSLLGGILWGCGLIAPRGRTSRT
jgi:hypothetical protein